MTNDVHRKIMPVIFACMMCFGICAVQADMFWISPHGSAGGTGTQSNPFPSIKTAIERVGGGHTFIFKPGYYVGEQITLFPRHAGTPQKPTVLKSQEKYKAIIHGSPFHDFYIRKGCKWVVIDGFDVGGAGYTGVKSNGDYTVIRNCRIHNNALHGIEAHNVIGTVIENNLIEYNGKNPQFDHGIYSSGDNVTIRNNIIRCNAGFGLHLYPHISNSRIENNLIFGNIRWGILLLSKTKADNRIINNTIVDNGAGIIVGPKAGDIIVNNIVVNNTGWKFSKPGSIQVNTGGDLSQVRIEHNLCVPPYRGPGANNISGDPMFLDLKKGVFFLKKNSPAVANGSPEFAPARDFFGHTRSQEKKHDFGCFPFTESLLSPNARKDWYEGWAYVAYYREHGDGQIPDFWKMPDEK